MSQANLKLLGLYAVWLGGGFVLMVLTVGVNGLFLLPLLLLMIGLALLSYRVRCSRCGWSLIKRGYFVMPFAPKHCPNCGEKVV